MVLQPPSPQPKKKKMENSRIFFSLLNLHWQVWCKFSCFIFGITACMFTCSWGFFSVSFCLLYSYFSCNLVISCQPSDLLLCILTICSLHLEHSEALHFTSLVVWAFNVGPFTILILNNFPKRLLLANVGKMVTTLKCIFMGVSSKSTIFSSSSFLPTHSSMAYHESFSLHYILLLKLEVESSMVRYIVLKPFKTSGSDPNSPISLKHWGTDKIKQRLHIQSYNRETGALIFLNFNN